MNEAKQKLYKQLEDLKQLIIKSNFKQAVLLSLDIAIKLKELRDMKR